MVDSSTKWLRQLLAQPAPSADRASMALSGAFLFGSGALMVLITVLTSRAADTAVIPIGCLIVIALLVTAVVVVGREAIPVRVYPYLVLLGTLLITGLLYFDGARASAYSNLYVWCALYSFYFFTPAVAIAETLFVAICSGLEFGLREATNVPTTRWLMIVGTSVVAGIVIRQLVSQVRSLADRDGLTGLVNRRRMEVELDREMSRAQRTQSNLCVAILDLDHFKVFNDEMGHLEGDRHLKKTTGRWLGELRLGDVLARYGGEEFVVILPACARFDALRTADRLRSAVPDGQTVSAGVAHWDGEESRASLLGRADIALYEAKVAGRDRTVESAGSSSLVSDVHAPQAWAKMFPAVLESRGIRFCYQPIVVLADRSVFAYEALARPSDIDLDVSVEGFFAAAQRLGYGRDLDWLCRRLCLETSRQVLPKGTLFMNIGVSALLVPIHAVDQMTFLLAWAGWSASDVVLEITERELISDLGRLQTVLASYRTEGFRFAMDDVGDGHSTLEVLAAGAPEFIKIARRLTANADRPGMRAAIQAVAAFAASLGSVVIAEGIESAQQADLMSALGCHMGQGFALGRPTWPRLTVDVNDLDQKPVLNVLSA